MQGRTRLAFRRREDSGRSSWSLEMSSLISSSLILPRRPDIVSGRRLVTRGISARHLAPLSSAHPFLAASLCFVVRGQAQRISGSMMQSERVRGEIM
jgi:hypothetical protein